MYLIPGYSLYTNTRNVYGSGVAVYVDDEYDSSGVKELIVCRDACETICVEVKNMTKKSICICAYRPPSRNFSDFYETMRNLLTSVHDRKYQDIYVSGNFSLNLLNSTENVNDFINLIFSYSLFPSITKPTRATSSLASLIDQTWTPKIETNIGNYVIDTDINRSISNTCSI